MDRPEAIATGASDAVESVEVVRADESSIKTREIPFSCASR